MAEDRPGVTAWPEYAIPCSTCGAGCRPVDRFCSQCGRRDPTGRFGPATVEDALLTSPTMVGSNGPDIDQYPQLSPTMYSVEPVSFDDEPPNPEPADQTIVLTPEEAAHKSHPPSASSSGALRSRTARSTAGRRAKQAANAAALEQMLVPGNVFGRRYRIQRFLGAGAMGYVCSAVDNSIDEIVALKILSAPVADDPDAFERFKLELKLARKIRHRNVVQSFDLGFADGYPYISMEYIDADNLLKHMARKPYDEAATLPLLRQILRGLRAAHELGIIHRDIKPENILVNKDGVAFITDFGIATTADLVRRREIAGTPDYMSPEQLRCEDVAPASDLYACGVMLYRILTGKLPFKATSIHEMIEAHLHQQPLALPDDVQVSPIVRDLISWMLQKKISDRPQSAQAVLEKIDEVLSSRKTRSLSQRVTVLVAEQDPQTMTSVRSALESDGYKVIAATTASDAVNLAFDQHPQVILIDAAIRGGLELVHPDDDTTPGSIPIAGADGLGFCRIVRADDKLRRVPIVVMSEPSESSLKNVFSQSGAADFLLKPLAASEITSAVRRVHVASIEAKHGAEPVW
jgi:serine/threonine protein kinase